MSLKLVDIGRYNYNDKLNIFISDNDVSIKPSINGSYNFDLNEIFNLLENEIINMENLLIDGSRFLVSNIECLINYKKLKSVKLICYIEILNSDTIFNLFKFLDSKKINSILYISHNMFIVLYINLVKSKYSNKIKHPMDNVLTEIFTECGCCYMITNNIFDKSKITFYNFKNVSETPRDDVNEILKQFMGDIDLEFLSKYVTFNFTTLL